MTNSPDSFNLDVRIRERLLKKRVITAATIDSHLAGLKDGEADSVTLELEQPALAKPPAVVAPVVQPVQPVRTSMADLPPPPPGLIKESPTPPYTPMVIENVPRESSVNGVSLDAASEDDDDLDDGELDDADGVVGDQGSSGAADAVQADTVQADAAQSDTVQRKAALGEASQGETIQAEAAQAEAAQGEAIEPKGEGVDDEWG